MPTIVETLHDTRSATILGLRPAELVEPGTEDFQVREGHWAIADLIGKGKHLRTVPVPAWPKGASGGSFSKQLRGWLPTECVALAYAENGEGPGR
jgi:hypothetical protein